MARRLREGRFSDVRLSAPFFDSLRAAYPPFDAWFAGKLNEPILIIDDGEELTGIVYTKVEHGPIVDVSPVLREGKWLKVGTMKVVARGTKLGERVLKRIFDEAVSSQVDGIYVTLFDVHEDLANLFCRYGFDRWGTKTTIAGTEIVLVRQFGEINDNPLTDYPFIRVGVGTKPWLLAVYPEFHTRLFPDSILKNENEAELVKDIPSANTIHKVYIGRLPLTRMDPGDPVVLYRTSDTPGKARFRSVATSICVVEEVRSRDAFFDESDFLSYCAPHSVFSEDELVTEYRQSRVLYVARMTYNASFERRPTRGDLIDIVGISEQPRWDLRLISLEQFRAVARLGGVDARLVIDKA